MYDERLRNNELLLLPPHMASNDPKLTKSVDVALLGPLGVELFIPQELWSLPKLFVRVVHDRLVVLADAVA